MLATAKKEHKQAAANGFLKVLSQLSEKVPLLKEDLITAYATGVAQGTGSWSSSSFSEEAVKCLESDRFDTLAGKVLKFYKDIFVQFVEYFKLNSCKLKTMDLLHIELDCADQLGEMEMSTVDQLIVNCLPFGRLTMVLKNLDKHTNGNEIARKLHGAGLHIYASISGHRSPDFYEKIYNHCDVINFELLAIYFPLYW